MKRRSALLLLLLLTACSLFAAHAAGGRAVEAANTFPRRCIALTFDDGPSSQTTARLLDGLRERGAHATFFLIGEQIVGNEDLVRRMKDEGHQVGNHSFTHARLDAADETALGEIRKTDEALRALPEGMRYAVVLVYLDGCTMRECAKMLRVPEGTVKSRLSRAKALLRDYLSEEA